MVNNTNSNLKQKIDNLNNYIKQDSKGSLGIVYMALIIVALFVFSGAGIGIHKCVVYFQEKKIKPIEEEKAEPIEKKNEDTHVNKTFEESIKEKYLIDNLSDKNETLKADLSSMLSLRENNYKRQVFLEVMLLNLVQKHKELLKEVEEYKRTETDNSDKMKQVLYINQLLQNKINNIMDEKKDVEREKGIIKNLGKTFKFMKVGPKMYKELQKMNLDKNLPDSVKENIEKKGMVQVVKV